MNSETDGQAHGVVATGSASAQMRAAREAAGLQLTEVAARTRVPLRHLEALERGDFAALPGITYCAGFTRAYARAV
ncbi:MAG: helix-turn-helix transcriptional regulator, partial [Sphingobium sp.]